MCVTDYLILQFCNNNTLPATCTNNFLCKNRNNFLEFMKAFMLCHFRHFVVFTVVAMLPLTLRNTYCHKMLLLLSLNDSTCGKLALPFVHTRIKSNSGFPTHLLLWSTSLWATLMIDHVLFEWDLDKEKEKHIILHLLTNCVGIHIHERDRQEFQDTETGPVQLKNKNSTSPISNALLPCCQASTCMRM